MGGHVAAIVLLLEWRAKIDAKDECNQGPLHYAVNGQHAGTVRLLLERGANIESRNLAGSTLCASLSRGIERLLYNSC